MQVVLAALVIADCTSYMPRNPNEQDDPILQVSIAYTSKSARFAATSCTMLPCIDSHLSTALFLQVWLQQFAWLEREKPEKVAERATYTSNPGTAKSLNDEPLFCLETALKAIYWATLVYRYKGPDDTKEPDKDYTHEQVTSGRSFPQILILCRRSWGRVLRSVLPGLSVCASTKSALPVSVSIQSTLAAAGPCWDGQASDQPDEA